MRKILLLAMAALMFPGCGKDTPGPVGPQGPQGAGSNGFQQTFEWGLYPDTTYQGSQCHYVDGGNPNSAPSTGEIRVGTGISTGSVQLGLIRFDLSGYVPVNTTLTGAILELTTETTSTLSPGSFEFGVHQVTPPPAGQVPWNMGSTWNVVVPPFGWEGGSSSPIAAGVDYSNSPADAVTLTNTQVNGKEVPVGWSIPAALAWVWVDPRNDNYGILISPEPEISAALSGSIQFWDNTGNAQECPRLVIKYTIP